MKRAKLLIVVVCRLLSFLWMPFALLYFGSMAQGAAPQRADLLFMLYLVMVSLGSRWLHGRLIDIGWGAQEPKDAP